MRGSIRKSYFFPLTRRVTGIASLDSDDSDCSVFKAGLVLKMPRLLFATCGLAFRPPSQACSLTSDSTLLPARCFEQEPRASLGFIDPNFDQTRGSNVTMLIAHVVHFAKPRGQRPVVVS